MQAACASGTAIACASAAASNEALCVCVSVCLFGGGMGERERFSVDVSLGRNGRVESGRVVYLLPRMFCQSGSKRPYENS